ncbi:hypothetical protein AVEN_208415-1 [Araneus ventricosus]|uniref:Uncharacterized protein n=1 Tax=Araneus ventricosus TaxID=182803 RepID=A0A4Y2VDW1_ARAVE|nr:hypothetical protein AVEN_230368-1 [Araneus ventricosus]GBO22306.1 hypothetical protein AVEN_208415-1 [Araneus ventricosus]
MGRYRLIVIVSMQPADFHGFAVLRTVHFASNESKHGRKFDGNYSWIKISICPIVSALIKYLLSGLCWEEEEEAFEARSKRLQRVYFLL